MVVNKVPVGEKFAVSLGLKLKLASVPEGTEENFHLFEFGLGHTLGRE